MGRLISLLEPSSDCEVMVGVEWVDRLQEATGWQEHRWECDWEATESALGTRLPKDYKELCARFGPGEFSDSLWVMHDRGTGSLLSWWRGAMGEFKQHAGSMARMYSPYGFYGVNGRRGLLQWGSSDAPGRFFWLADAGEDPDAWPVLAREEMIVEMDWEMPGMSMSEFVYRMVTDPESHELSMLRPQLPPTFRRDPSVSST